MGPDQMAKFGWSLDPGFVVRVVLLDTLATVDHFTLLSSIEFRFEITCAVKSLIQNRTTKAVIKDYFSKDLTYSHKVL